MLYSVKNKSADNADGGAIDIFPFSNEGMRFIAISVNFSIF